MTTTCGIRCLISFALFPILSMAQSLEDKVSQSRKLQAMGQSDMSQSAIDSAISERSSINNQTGPVKGPIKPRAKPRDAEQIPDSLLTGPGDADSLDTTDINTLDPVNATNPKYRLKAKAGKKLPKRYEQRIFQSFNRSVFVGASGAAGREYILGPGDEIVVSLWGDKEKEYALQLNKEGRIFLEGIGLVALAGLNLDEARTALKEKLAKVYSGIGRGTTHVDLSLGKTGPIRVFVLGEVKTPGGYVFTGQTSLLTALYYAKGPTDIGTVRNLQLTRSGKKFTVDLYQYLIKGESLSPHALQDGDILFAGRAEALVTIEGDVGRPAVYELKKGEGIKELMEFAGGLNPTAATQKLSIKRIYPGGKSDFIDVAPPQDYTSGKAKMELLDGDHILVEKSSEVGKNFITLTGPVKYPGVYEANGINSVEQLVSNAGGLREDAFLGRVHIVRFNPDGSSKLFAYSLDTTQVDSIRLQPRDNVILYSLKDMYLPDSVQIEGAVFKAGRYEFREGMTAKDLVMQAGGYLPHHQAGRILVFRGTGRERQVEQINLAVEDGMAKTEEGFPLRPNDLVQIPVDPKWYLREVVTLEGLVMHPGKYALLYPGEKLTSVVERAGGFKENAYIEGGRFYRSKDSVGRVGISIANAIRKPRSKVNIPMVGGDSIYIPERLNTVKVIGEVGFETSLLFQEGSSVQYYIEKAGGFTRRSEKDRVVVQYANGETSRDGYFNRKPDAGSVIYVPQGPEPVPINWATNINFMLGTLTAGITLIILANQVTK